MWQQQGSPMNLRDVLQAEAMACIEVLNLGICFGTRHATVETDSKQLVQAINDDGLDNGIDTAVIREVQNLLSLEFDVIKVVC